MVKRPGRVGQWVLPTAVVFVSLAVVWAVVSLLADLLGGEVKEFLQTTSRIVGIVEVLTIIAGAATLSGIAYLLLAGLQLQLRAADHSQQDELARRQMRLLEHINEGIMLSDRAKAVSFREKEREALRGAIQEELARHDWEAAYHLIDEMQRSFGYHAEAERLRGGVDQRRREVILATLAAEVGSFRELLHARNWAGARGKAEKLIAQYPGETEVARLATEVDDAKEGHKRHLLSEFKQAIDRSEVDRGVEILKELDQYLTPGEAAGLQEAARGVFREKLQRLGVQFSIAVSEKNWTEALKIGQEIVTDFPNSRMAEEVRQNTETLHRRASRAAPAATAPQ